MKRKKILAASILPIAALIIFLVLGPNTKTPAGDVASATRLPAPRVAFDGVPNAGKVTPTLFRGAQPAPEGFNSLANNGIAVVVDLRFEGDRDAEMRAVTHAGMQYVAMPWSCHFPRDSITARFLQFVRANSGEKMFVHCEHGVDRTGLMIAAYRMADEGWTPEQARREMIAYGFDAFHRNWCSSLGAYELSFPQRFSSSPEFDSLRPAAQK